MQYRTNMNDNSPEMKQHILDTVSVQGYLTSLIWYEDRMNAIIRRLRSGEPYKREMSLRAVNGNSRAYDATRIYPETPEITQRAERVTRLCREIRAYERPQ